MRVRDTLWMVTMFKLWKIDARIDPTRKVRPFLRPFFFLTHFKMRHGLRRLEAKWRSERIALFKDYLLSGSNCYTELKVTYYPGTLVIKDGICCTRGFNPK